MKEIRHFITDVNVEYGHFYNKTKKIVQTEGKASPVIKSIEMFTKSEILIRQRIDTRLNRWY